MTHLLAPVSGVLAALQHAALYCNGADGACSAEWLPQQSRPLAQPMMLLLLLSMSLPTTTAIESPLCSVVSQGLAAPVVACFEGGHNADD